MVRVLMRFASGKGSDHQRRPGRRFSSPQTIVAVTVLALVAVTSGHCGVSRYLARLTSQAPRNHVAVKVAELNEKNHSVSVRGLSFSPDGNHIAVRSAGEDVDIWNWRSGRIQRTIQAPRGFASGSSSNPIHYSPDGRMLAICEDKGAGNVVVRVWNTGDWSIKRDIVDNGPGVCRGVAFTPDGRFLIYLMFRVIQSSDLTSYSTASWRMTSRVQLGAWPRIGIEPRALAVSPDGRLLAFSGAADIAVKAGAAPREFAPMRREPIVGIVNLSTATVERTCRVEEGDAIAWRPDGLRIAVVGGQHAEMVDATSCERTVGNGTPRSSRMDVRITPDGRYLIESDSNGERTGLGVSIWNNTGRELLQRIAGDSPSIAISSDGKFLAIGGIGRTTVWQLK